jgi:hypothetical protein
MSSNAPRILGWLSVLSLAICLYVWFVPLSTHFQADSPFGEVKESGNCVSAYSQWRDKSLAIKTGDLRTTADNANLNASGIESASLGCISLVSNAQFYGSGLFVLTVSLTIAWLVARKRTRKRPPSPPTIRLH